MSRKTELRADLHPIGYELSGALMPGPGLMRGNKAAGKNAVACGPRVVSSWVIQSGCAWALGCLDDRRRSCWAELALAGLLVRDLRVYASSTWALRGLPVTRESHLRQARAVLAGSCVALTSD